MRRPPRTRFAVTIVAPKRYPRMKRCLLQKDQILDVVLRSTIVFFPPVAQIGRHCEIALAAAHGGPAKTIDSDHGWVMTNA
jgi:hypothetical protein